MGANRTENLIESLAKGNNKYLLMIDGTRGIVTKEVVCEAHKLNLHKRSLLNEYNKETNDTSKEKYKEIFSKIGAN